MINKVRGKSRRKLKSSIRGLKRLQKHKGYTEERAVRILRLEDILNEKIKK